MYEIAFGVILIVILFIIPIRYCYSRRHINLAKQIGGPFSVPLIGNGLQLICKNEDVLQRLFDLVENYPQPMRLWIGTSLTICFKDPNHVEKILLSPKFSQKHRVYDFMKSYLGEGLVTASGPVYKKHRKLIAPMLNNQFFKAHYDVFGKHSDILLQKLGKLVDQEPFDILPFIHKCIVDIVGETILGIEFKSQDGHNLEFVQTANKIYNLGFTRLAKPWLYPDVIFNRSTYKKFQVKYMSVLELFIQQLCQDSVDRIRANQSKEIDENAPIIDQISHFREENPGFMSDDDFLSHMLTLYFASEDTISSICAFTCLCLGMYPEYQKKLAHEILDTFGKEPRPVTIDDIRHLSYLDKCIKDVLRLFPIAPYILRRATDDCQVGKWLIPEGVSIIIPIFNVHRDRTHWQNPEHFYPDHFLESEVERRHPYAYLPFSAGPRGCIGKTFTNIGLKVILSTLLQNFEFVADGKVPNLKLRMDISVRSVNGHKVKLRKRTWS